MQSILPKFAMFAFIKILRCTVMETNSILPKKFEIKYSNKLLESDKVLLLGRKIINLKCVILLPLWSQEHDWMNCIIIH